MYNLKADQLTTYLKESAYAIKKAVDDKKSELSKESADQLDLYGEKIAEIYEGLQGKITSIVSNTTDEYELDTGLDKLKAKIEALNTKVLAKVSKYDGNISSQSPDIEMIKHTVRSMFESSNQDYEEIMENVKATSDSLVENIETIIANNPGYGEAELKAAVIKAAQESFDKLKGKL
ncbi:MAG: hypothetical protein IIZ11_02140 [Erysipelotrichaceae bacterium]|nr:hypothetical protein [Erysipelotrichaceae bacterium]